MNNTQKKRTTCRQTIEDNEAQLGIATSSLRAEPALVRQLGLTLVELMVAMLISTFILIGLVQIFATTRTTYQADEGLARLQENGRFAIDYLVRDIRMAGGMGCLGKIPPDQQNYVWNYLNGVTAGSAFDLSTGISGYEAPGTAPGQIFPMPILYPPTNVSTTVPALDPLVPGAVAGTDVLALRFMDGSGVPLVVGANGKYHDLTKVYAGVSATSLAQDYNIALNSIVIVSNCKQAAVFQVTNSPVGASPVDIVHGVGGPGSPGNACAVWGTTGCKGYIDAFQAGSQISALRSRFFYIARNSKTVAAPTDIPSLFRRDAGTPPPASELVEGVENMQILYGIDSNTQNDTGQDGHTADRYLPADQVTDWSRVVSVRIGLLVSTLNTEGKSDTTADAATYSVSGVTLNVAGVEQLGIPNLRRRRVFTTTVGLRNL